MKAILLAAGVMMASGQAGANGYFIDGNTLYGICQTDPKSAEMFAMAAIDAFTFGGTAFPSSRGATVCVPSSARSPQLRDLVCQALEKNPADRHLAASRLAWETFTDAFPCSQ